MWGSHCNCRMTQGMGLVPRTDWERGKAESWKGPPSTSIMRDTMTTKGFALRREFICTWRKTGAGDVVLSLPSTCRPRTRDKARVCVCCCVQAHGSGLREATDGCTSNHEHQAAGVEWKEGGHVLLHTDGSRHTLQSRRSDHAPGSSIETGR
jgi:hypothetical protein